jgi:hypothetical protein
MCDAEEDEESAADLPDDSPLDGNGRFGDSLDYCSHGN